MAEITIILEPSYKKEFAVTIRKNAEKAIKRVENFTKSLEFERADHVLLEIKIELVEENFKKFLKYNDLLACLDPNLDQEKQIEEDYIQIKAKIKRRQEFLCAVDEYSYDYDHNIDNVKNNKNQNEKEQKTVSPFPSIAIFSGSQTEYKAFMETFNAQVGENSNLTESDKVNYLKSHLSDAASDLVKDINNYAEILETLNRSYGRSALQRRLNEMSSKPAHTAFLNIRDITNELYQSIKDGAYGHAVEVTKNISENGHGVIISDMVMRLAQENNKNLLSYVYSLWVGGAQSIVTDRLPHTFSSLFNADKVIVEQKEYGLALKLDANTDSAGDRKAWGDSSDKTSNRVTWKVIPIWDSNEVYFRLKNIDCDMYLKLELYPDDIGDRGAYGESNGDTMRFTWSLEPEVINGEILFYIINRQFGQGLKLGVDTDSYKDRVLWGHNGDVHCNPAHYAWYIKKLKTNDDINEEL